MHVHRTLDLKQIAIAPAFEFELVRLADRHRPYSIDENILL